MNISVLGCGRWGSCIAWYLDKIGNNVISCGLADAPEFIQLSTTHKTTTLLSRINRGYFWPCKGGQSRRSNCYFYFISTFAFIYAEHRSKQSWRQNHCALYERCWGSNGSKTQPSCRRLCWRRKTPIAVWVGPGHPQDYVKGIPNCMVIDSKNHEIKEKLVNSFSSSLIRFYVGTDLIGSEIGAAAKMLSALPQVCLTALAMRH